MAGELKKLCKLLQADDVDLRYAAARVLGELKPRDAVSIRSLGEAVSSDNSEAGICAINALGNIKSTQALQFLIPCLNAGEERRAAAAEAIEALGASALAELRKEFSSLNSNGRISAVDIVIDHDRTLAPGIILGLLAENDSVDVAAHICERLKSIFESLTQKARESLLSKLRKYLATKKVAENAIAIVAGLRLLSFLRHPKAMPIFIEHLGEDRPPAARRQALGAISAMPPPKGPDVALVTALIPLITDRTYPDLVEAALRILSKIKIPASMTDEIVKLLYNHQSAVRRLAVRALGNFNSSKAARALLACLGRTDWELSSETITALRRIKCTADLILKEIHRTKDRDRARGLVAILRGAHFRTSPASIQDVTRRFFQMLHSQHEMSEVYYSLLLNLNGEKLSQVILGRARKLRKAGKFSEAEYHLRLLAQSSPVGSGVKYELGLARLKLSSKNVAKEERLADPALPLFTELLHDPNFSLFKQLSSETNTVDAGDCYYLGYHFAEGSAIEREFAKLILKHAIRLSPDSAQSDAARKKLIAERLAPPPRTARKATTVKTAKKEKSTAEVRKTKAAKKSKSSSRKAARKRARKKR